MNFGRRKKKEEIKREKLTILLAVLEWCTVWLLVRVEEAHGWLLALLERQGPRAVHDVGGNVVGATVRVTGVDIHIQGAGRGVVLEVWVHASDFTGVGIHATGGLARLDIAPNHGCHVFLVVHEAGVEVRCFVWVWRHDVGEASGELVARYR